MMLRALTQSFQTSWFLIGTGAGALVLAAMGQVALAAVVLAVGLLGAALKEQTFIQELYKLHRTQTGVVANTGAFVAIIAGVLVIVFGLILSSTVLSQAATSGSDANIGSFSGARNLNDLIPFIYYAVVAVIGVGLMSLGGISMVKGGQ